MPGKKTVVINLFLTIIIVLVGGLLLVKMMNKRFVALGGTIQTSNSNAKIDQKRSDLSVFEDQLIDTINTASSSVVSIIISKNVRFYIEDPSNMYGPGAIAEQEAKVGGGSGIIFSKDGYIITNKHVVDDVEAKYSVVLHDGTIYNVDKVRFDDNLDIAVLKIVDEEGYMPTDLVAAQIASIENQVQIGQFALAIGNSLAEYQNSVTMGIISARNRELKINTNNLYIGLYQTDTPINPGNSGGPLLDIYGNVIGINTAMSTMADGVAFALPITQEFVDATLKSIIEYNKIIRPLIGIAYIDISSDIQKQLKLSVNNGVIIKDVFSDLPASVAGIQENDIITAIDDKIIDQYTPFLYQLYTYTPGDTVNFSVLREGNTMRIPIALGKNQ